MEKDSGRANGDRNQDAPYQIAVSSVVPLVIARQTQGDLMITMAAPAGLESARVFSLTEGFLTAIFR